MKTGLYTFLLAMWGLIILGGGIVVLVLGPISISGFGSYDMLISSVLKAIVAIVLAVIWVLILSKVKNWMFRKDINV